VDRVVEDVLECLVVLLCGFDLFRPEAATEDVVLAAVAIVERAGVLTVQVTHPVREVGERRFDEEVVVIAEQAAGVQPPAVATADAPQDLGEDGPVSVVPEDRGVVIALRPDVVVGAGGEVATRSSHRGDRTGGRRASTQRSATWRRVGTDTSGARQQTPPQVTGPNG
jgi:hypothetical protein